MKITEPQSQTRDVVVDVKCDVCGRMCPKCVVGGATYVTYGVLTFKAGYGSEHDGSGFTLEICEDCCVKLYLESGRTDAV